MMPLSEMLSYLAESFMRLTGAMVAVLFGFGYMGRLTGQTFLLARPVRFVGLAIGVAMVIGGSALMRWLIR